MKITPIQTRVLHPPQDDLLAVLSEGLNKFSNHDILVVTSKVVSLHQGRCVKIDKNRQVEQKQELIKQEADALLPLATTVNLLRSPLTKKYELVVGSAGIDESNGDGYFILWPESPADFAADLYEWLKDKFGVTDFGVLVTDTIKRPFRRGAVGFALAHYGFRALQSYRGKNDLFGRQFKSEYVNIADALAAGAVLAMGEGDEQTPLAIVKDVNRIEFFAGTDKITISGRDDYFSGLIDDGKWEKGK